MKPWTELTDLERREQVALRLGWTFREVPYTATDRFAAKIPEGQAHTYWAWFNPQGEFEQPRRWTTNDGLAFAELWPKIEEWANTISINPHGKGKKQLVLTRRTGTLQNLEIYTDVIEHLDADAISRAFCELVPLPEGK